MIPNENFTVLISWHWWKILKSWSTLLELPRPNWWQTPQYFRAMKPIGLLKIPYPYAHNIGPVLFNSQFWLNFLIWWIMNTLMWSWVGFFKLLNLLHQKSKSGVIRQLGPVPPILHITQEYYPSVLYNWPKLPPNYKVLPGCKHFKEILVKKLKHVLA